MPFSSIIQCDLCPVVTDDFEKFYDITYQVKPPSSDERKGSHRRTMLCAACAETILTLDRKLIEKNGTVDHPINPAKKLNERILAALKKTE